MGRGRPRAATARFLGAAQLFRSLALVKRADRTRSDDPLLRELYDELTTLKRTLYAENPKRAWLTGGLQSIRRLLEEAATHSVGDELKAS